MRTRTITASSEPVTHVISTVKDYWWPTFAFLHPFFMLALYSGGGFPHTHSVYLGFVSVFLIGGAALFYDAASAWLARPHLDRSWREWFQVLAVIAIALLIAISTLTAVDPIQAFLGPVTQPQGSTLLGLMHLCLFVLAYLSCYRDPEYASRVVWSLIAGSVLAAALALIEVFWSVGFYYPVTWREAPMVSFESKGHLAGFFVLGLALTAAVWMRGRSWLPLLLAAPIALALGTTFNRAALVALVVVLLALLRRPKRALVFGLLVASLIYSAMAFRQVRTDDYTKDLGGSSNVSARLVLWRIALDGISDRPLLGWGTDQFRFVWGSTAPEPLLHAWWEHFDLEFLQVVEGDHSAPMFLLEEDGAPKLIMVDIWRPHNYLLSTALDWGVPATVLLVVLALIAMFPLTFSNPAQIGILGYAVFLLFWPLPAQLAGVVWLLLGCATAYQAREQSPIAGTTKILPHPTLRE